MVTEKEDEIPNLKAACKALNGKMASEDLKDRLLKFDKNNIKQKNDIKLIWLKSSFLKKGL